MRKLVCAPCVTFRVHCSTTRLVFAFRHPRTLMTTLIVPVTHTRLRNGLIFYG